MIDIIIRKHSKKGFTLVEIIVVLVIIAILAAAAIPTMLGFVDDARGKAVIAEARAIQVALRTISLYAYTGTRYATEGPNAGNALYDTGDYTGVIRGYPGNPAAGLTYLQEINRLTGQSYTTSNFVGKIRFAPKSENTGEVVSFTFTSGNVTVVYDRAIGYTATTKK